MTRKHYQRPLTRTKNPEPEKGSSDWVIWAAWADRVTFEEIQEQTGLTEAEVITTMRRNLKPSSFKRWRKRASQVSIKHRRKFEAKRQQLREPSFREMADESFNDEQ